MASLWRRALRRLRRHKDGTQPAEPKETKGGSKLQQTAPQQSAAPRSLSPQAPVHTAAADAPTSEPTPRTDKAADDSKTALPSTTAESSTQQNAAATVTEPRGSDTHETPRDVTTEDQAKEIPDMSQLSISGNGSAERAAEDAAASTQLPTEEISTGKTESYDLEVEQRPAVVHEHIRPHVHTVYEPQLIREFHTHEHRTLIQPVIDPTPEVLPVQHWLQDGETGEMVPVSSEVGAQLANTAGITTSHTATSSGLEQIVA